MANPWDNDPVAGSDQPWMQDAVVGPSAPAAPAQSGFMDVSKMSKDQLMEAYRTLPRDDPQREAVKQALMQYTAGPTMNGAQSAVAGATDALSLGLSDEINAGLAGLTGGDYNAELSAQRQMMQSAEQDNPGAYMGGELAGSVAQALATGNATGLWKGATRALPAATWGGRVVQTGARLAKPAAEAAVTGAVYGFNSGEGGLENRLKNAAVTGAESAALAPAVAAAGKVVGKTINKFKGQSEIWSAKDLKDMSQSLYRQANQVGAAVSPNTLANVGRRMIGNVTGDLRYSPNVPNSAANEAIGLIDRVFVKRGPQPAQAKPWRRPPMGQVPTTGPGVAPGASTFTGTSTPNLTGGRPTSLEELDLVRGRLTELAAKAAKSDKSEARMIYGMRDELDKTISNLTPADMHSGTPEAFDVLKRASQLWKVKSETEWVDRMARRAKNKAGQLSISAKENALRTVARQAADNETRMARVGPTVQAAVEKVANPGIIPNTIRKMNKFAPGGAASTIITALKPVVGIPLMAAGGAAQIATNKITAKNWRKLERAVQRALPQKAIPIPLAERIARRATPFAVPGLLGGGQGDITVEPTRYGPNGEILN